MMRHLPLTLVLCAIGFGLSYRASAEEPAYPFQVGDKIRLLYEGSGARDCDVAAIRGQMVRCAQRTNDEWMNLAITLGIDFRR